MTRFGSTRPLGAIRMVGLDSRYYQASDSEMLGPTPPRNEATPFWPRSPYGAAMVYACWMTRNYPEAYGMFAVNGILFSHASPRRSEAFVTRKISKGVANIVAGRQDFLYMGNLDAIRDWGYAKEYVEAMWLMLQADEPTDEPTDYVVDTGTAHSVRDFLQFAFEHVGLEWQKYVRFDERYLRPSEVDSLIGDPSKVESLLSWKPQTLTPDLARLMVEADMGGAAAALLPGRIGSPSRAPLTV